MKCLDDFIKYLDKTIENKNLKNYIDELDKYVGNDWKKFIKPIKKNHDKEYHKETIYKNNIFDLHIISWYTHSPIHDHAENGCIFKLLEGNMIEEKYNKNINLTSKKHIKKNMKSYIGNECGYHKMINNNNGNESYSLHIYSPPLYKINKF